jgi:2-polyprenyl-6-methoxyphenol hydroxylase-like FAD-dependent oxidoreductase
MHWMKTDVVIVGAGPTGLMLAAELRLAGVEVLVLERQAEVQERLRAGGLFGQIVPMLHYRGILQRFQQRSEPSPPLTLPFGSLHVDFSAVEDPAMQIVRLPQWRLERLLEERACELGARVLRGYKLEGMEQDSDGVEAQVQGPEGACRVSGRFLVGCDGARSRVRDLAGIAFPGTTYPEVNRMLEATVPAGVRVLENGDLQVEGLGRVPFGYTQTAAGQFAVGSVDPGKLMLFTTEEESTEYPYDGPMSLDEMRDSIRRVLGSDLPLGDPRRLTRFTFQARQVDRYRAGRILVAGDAAHLFPAGGIALNAGLMDAVNLGWKLGGEIRGWAPGNLLDSYHEERHYAGTRTLLHTQAQVALRRGHDPAAVALRQLVADLLRDEQPVRRLGAHLAGSDLRYPGAEGHALAGTFAPDLRVGSRSVAELLHRARPVLVHLDGASSMRESAQGWLSRVDVHSGLGDEAGTEALLIRPDGYIAWAGASDDAVGLRAALARWFGPGA